MDRFEHDSTTSLSSCSVCSIISPTSHLNDPNDTWVCLVCGFVGCGPRGMNHSQRHYQDHLHAYAMNTETKRVWDYAGEGYVHRLILSRPDTADSVSQSDLSSLTPLPLTHQSSRESKGNYPISFYSLTDLQRLPLLILLELKLWKSPIQEGRSMDIVPSIHR
jgi:hypothetical protein